MNPLWLLHWHFAANGIFACVMQSIYNALSSAQLTHTCALFIEPPPLLRCIIMFYGSLHLLIPPNYHPAKSQCLGEQTTGQAALWEQHQSHLAGASDKPKPTITIYSGFVTPLHPPQKTLHPHLPAEKHQVRISCSSCQIKFNILLVFCCREKWLLYQTCSSLLSQRQLALTVNCELYLDVRASDDFQRTREDVQRSKGLRSALIMCINPHISPISQQMFL